MKKWRPARLCQLVGLFLVHVRPRSNSHLRGVVRLLLPILLPLLPPHGLTKDHGLKNRHLPALVTLKPEPLLNRPGVLPSISPLPRSRCMWRLPPDQYRHGSPVLSWMACLSLLILAFGYGRREKGEGGRIAQTLAQDLLLPEDVSAFAEGTKESIRRRLQWHTIAVTSLSMCFSFSYTPIIVIHTFYCRSCYCHSIRPLS